MNVDKPHDHDVLCGRGGHSYKHKGNILFHDLILQNKLEYAMSRKGFKKFISHRIVRTIRNQKPPGRFLELDPDTLLWNDVGKKRAIEKTCQALRDCQPKIRRRMENSAPSVLSQTPAWHSNSSTYSTSDTSTITAASSMSTLQESARDAIATRNFDLDPTALAHNSENQHESVYFTSSSPFSIPEQISCGSSSLCSTSDTSTITSASSSSIFLSSAMNSLENCCLNDDLNKPLAILAMKQHDIEDQPQHEELIGMQSNLHSPNNTRNINSSTDKPMVYHDYVIDNQNNETTDEEINELIFQTFANPATNTPMKTNISDVNTMKKNCDGILSYDQITDVTSPNAELSSLDGCNFESDIDFLIHQTFLDTENKPIQLSVPNLSELSKNTWEECRIDMKNGVGLMHQNIIQKPLMQEIHTYSSRAA